VRTASNLSQRMKLFTGMIVRIKPVLAVPTCYLSFSAVILGTRSITSAVARTTIVRATESEAIAGRRRSGSMISDLSGCPWPSSGS
jgi:hypothetical protein